MSRGALMRHDAAELCQRIAHTGVGERRRPVLSLSFSGRKLGQIVKGHAVDRLKSAASSVGRTAGRSAALPGRHTQGLVGDVGENRGEVRDGFPPPSKKAPPIPMNSGSRR